MDYNWEFLNWAGSPLGAIMKSMWKAVIAAVLLCCIFELGCGDTYRPIATPILQPAGNPGINDTVGVVQQVASGNGAITQINVSGDSAISQMPTGAGATMAALDSGRTTIFTPNFASESLTASSASTFTETTLTLPQGSKPKFVAGTKAGTMYVANPGTASVGIVDVANFTLLTSIPVTSDPEFLVQTSNGLKLFVIDPTNSKVTIVDTTSNTAESVLTVGTQPVYAVMSLDQNFLYVLNSGSNDISVIRLSDETVLPGTISTGGTGAQFMLMDTHLNRVYVTNTGSNSISAFDASTSSTPSLIGGAAVTVGTAPVQLTALLDGSRVYVLNGDASVTELLASNLTTLKKFTNVNTTAGATGTSIISSHDASRVYVGTADPSNTSNGVTIIRTTDDSIVKTIASPNIDPACASACPLMKPVFVFTRSN